MAWSWELSLEDNFMQAIRQGDVILLSLAQVVRTAAPQKFMTKLTHLTLAEGAVTGYSCRGGSEGGGRIAVRYAPRFAQ